MPISQRDKMRIAMGSDLNIQHIGSADDFPQQFPKPPLFWNWGQSVNLGMLLRPWLKRMEIWAMARSPRIEFAGAVYHVISRGDRGEAIYLDDDD